MHHQERGSIEMIKRFNPKQLTNEDKPKKNSVESNFSRENLNKIE